MLAWRRGTKRTVALRCVRLTVSARHFGASVVISATSRSEVRSSRGPVFAGLVPVTGSARAIAEGAAIGVAGGATTGAAVTEGAAGRVIDSSAAGAGRSGAATGGTGRSGARVA